MGQYLLVAEYSAYAGRATPSRTRWPPIPGSL